MYDEEEGVDEGGMPPLPTVEECQQFMEAINAGRAAIGLPTLAALNYDECECGHPEHCLSATHLFNAVIDDEGRRVGGNVGTKFVSFLEPHLKDSLITALGANRREATGAVVIPPAIRKVTDYFDQCVQGDPDWAALRDRFDEAGLLDA